MLDLCINIGFGDGVSSAGAGRVLVRVLPAQVFRRLAVRGLLLKSGRELLDDSLGAIVCGECICCHDFLFNFFCLYQI